MSTKRYAFWTKAATEVGMDSERDIERRQYLLDSGRTYSIGIYWFNTVNNLWHARYYESMERFKPSAKNNYLLREDLAKMWIEKRAKRAGWIIIDSKWLNVG